MSEYEDLPPAASLFESMRHIGYSLETAIADIVDNSVAASASKIRIEFEPNAEWVCIADDGYGMTREELRTAMRLAGTTVNTVRHERDLGRFGLGLKTASLSQAARLTVVSRSSHGEIAAARWDLEKVFSENSWKLEWLDPDSLSEQPWYNLLSESPTGTLVVWETLDILLDGFPDRKNALIDLMARAAEHLSLVFHRIIDGGPGHKLLISVNGKRLAAIDPFFQNNPATQRKPEELITIDGATVKVRAFVLPHLAKLNRDERANSDFLNSRFIETQGFYVYRLKRLISFGSWFRLTPKSELSKMARVMVDVSPDLDKLWKLGVMKSTLEVPSQIRARLRSLVPDLVNDSTRVVSKRGALVPPGKEVGAWSIYETGTHEFALRLDLGNPVLDALQLGLSATQQRLLRLYLDLVEDSLPVLEITRRVTSDGVQVQEKDLEQFSQKATALIQVFSQQGNSSEQAYEMLLRVPPFSNNVTARDYVLKHKGTLTNRGL